nr:uncharacterized protein LOC109155335 [Ipomoea batatas]
MDEAILRREEYLRKVGDMPSFSLGLTPPLGVEATCDNVVNISSQYQDVRATFPQAVSPSSEHQEEEQREVCEKGVALDERGGGVEMLTEKVYQEWIMQNPNADKFGATMLMRLELLSLKDHVYVTASVIDVWSIILNDLERFRDPNSPSRFFVTTYPCSYTVVDPQGDDEVRLESFKGRLHHELQRVAHIKLSVLDLAVSTDQKYGKVPSDLGEGDILIDNKRMSNLEEEEGQKEALPPAEAPKIQAFFIQDQEEEDQEKQLFLFHTYNICPSLSFLQGA